MCRGKLEFSVDSVFVSTEAARLAVSFVAIDAPELELYTTGDGLGARIYFSSLTNPELGAGVVSAAKLAVSLVAVDASGLGGKACGLPCDGLGARMYFSARTKPGAGAAAAKAAVASAGTEAPGLEYPTAGLGCDGLGAKIYFSWRAKPKSGAGAVFGAICAAATTQSAAKISRTPIGTTLPLDEMIETTSTDQKDCKA